jgi:acetyl esterase
MKVKNDNFDGVNVRIYTPKSEKQELPALIFYHGGGFVFGSIGEYYASIREQKMISLLTDSYDYFTYIMAKKLGMIVISVGYRLSPEHLYPIPIDDCWNATQYIFRNAQDLKIDCNRMVLCGDSAGKKLIFLIFF